MHQRIVGQARAQPGTRAVGVAHLAVADPVGVTSRISTRDGPRPRRDRVGVDAAPRGPLEGRPAFLDVERATIEKMTSPSWTART